MTAKPTVTRTPNGIYLVEGVIAVIRGKVVNTPFKRGFHLKYKADFEAERIAKINTEALNDLALQRAARLDVIKNYLAARAKRIVPQTSFNF